jgi:hypothetical protein
MIIYVGNAIKVGKVRKHVENISKTVDFDINTIQINYNQFLIILRIFDEFIVINDFKYLIYDYIA